MSNKSIFIVVFLLLISTKGMSQHLTYFDLLTLQSSSVEKCEEILSKKGFVLSDNEYNEESNETKLGWKYQNLGNEYFSKKCPSLVAGICKEINYITTSEVTFNNF
jgi:hypothetical protein